MLPSRKRRLLAALPALVLVALIGLATAAGAQPAPVPGAPGQPVPVQGTPAQAVPAQAAPAQPAPAPGEAAPADPALPAPGAQPPSPGGDVVPAVPDVPSVNVALNPNDPGLSRTVTMVLLLAAGSLAPALLLLMTTFTRFVVVFGLAKQALGLQTIPPAQVLVGLALFLTFFVMRPVLAEVNEEAVQPMLAGTMDTATAAERGFAPLRAFMLAQTREDDLRMFVELSDTPQLANPDDVPAATLLPAFAVSELRSAFITGFVIFIPFLVIDLVVAAVLMAMGMMMLPPVFISMPLKLLLFILVDGWALIIGAMVGGVNGVTA